MKPDKHSSNTHCSGICCIPVTCTWMLGGNSAYFQVRIVVSVKKIFWTRMETSFRWHDCM